MYWKWTYSKLGWWIGSAEGFNGIARAFLRDGTWCLRIEVGSDLSHFSEGYLSDGVAKEAASHWGDIALGLRRAAGWPT